MDDHTSKDQPQLVTVKRINSIYTQNPSNNSTTSLQDDQISSLSQTNIDKHASQSSLQTSISNIYFCFRLKIKRIDGKFRSLTK